MNLYNTQKLLFDKTTPIAPAPLSGLSVPEDFYSQGYTLVKGVKNADAAQAKIETLIANIDFKRLPVYQLFNHKIQLAKADIIPMCADSVETDFQALHFDMGQPFFSVEPQTMYVLIGLYFPKDSEPGSAKTRVLTLKGLLADQHLGSAKQLEAKILNYVKKHGDGWDEVNTYRLSCFARVIDALSDTTELTAYRDKTMAEWFADPKLKGGLARLKNEHAFYQKRQIAVDKKEVQITLQPGQLLIIDNLRAVHGRIGKRREQEVYQLMYGVQNASPKDISAFCHGVATELAA